MCKYDINIYLYWLRCSHEVDPLETESGSSTMVSSVKEVNDNRYIMKQKKLLFIIVCESKELHTKYILL